MPAQLTRTSTPPCCFPVCSNSRSTSESLLTSVSTNWASPARSSISLTQLLTGVDVAVGQHQTCAFTCKEQGRRSADAVRRTGDDGDLVA